MQKPRSPEISRFYPIVLLHIPRYSPSKRLLTVAPYFLSSLGFRNHASTSIAPILSQPARKRSQSESSSSWDVSSCSLTAILANAGPRVPISLSLVLILRLFLRALSCTIPGNILGELADMCPTASWACSDGDIMWIAERDVARLRCGDVCSCSGSMSVVDFEIGARAVFGSGMESATEA